MRPCAEWELRAKQPNGRTPSFTVRRRAGLRGSVHSSCLWSTQILQRAGVAVCNPLTLH